MQSSIQSLVQELPHAVGEAEKGKKKEKRKIAIYLLLVLPCENKNANIAFYFTREIHSFPNTKLKEISRVPVVAQ